MWVLESDKYIIFKTEKKIFPEPWTKLIALLIYL